MVLASKNSLGLGMAGGPEYMNAADLKNNRKVQNSIAICIKFCNGPGIMQVHFYANCALMTTQQIVETVRSP